MAKKRAKKKYFNHYLNRFVGVKKKRKPVARWKTQYHTSLLPIITQRKWHLPCDDVVIDVFSFFDRKFIQRVLSVTCRHIHNLIAVFMEKIPPYLILNLGVYPFAGSRKFYVNENYMNSNEMYDNMARGVPGYVRALKVCFYRLVLYRM